MTHMVRSTSRNASPVRKIRAPLLRWYDANRRDLPWRRSNDPYAIWISEAMLQQTRVETVIPYWERFLDRFPDVASLAQAELDDGMDVLNELIRVVRNGAFLPTDEPKDCKYCDYARVCGDSKTVAARSKGKLCDLDNKTLQPLRELRGQGTQENQ